MENLGVENWLWFIGHYLCLFQQSAYVIQLLRANTSEVMLMHMTVMIDDILYAKAVELTGIHDTTTLMQAGLIALIERESAHGLALLGGTETELEKIPRRQSKDNECSSY